jgi:hypothetical protein
MVVNVYLIDIIINILKKQSVSIEEYCETLDRMAQGSWNNWDAHQKKAFADAWSAHC